MKIKESEENYLETILVLKRRKGSVRSIDVANELGFSKPSVSVAMKQLRERGYLEVAADGRLLLTDSGEQRAAAVLERHTVIGELLMRLGVTREVALEDSCRVEHVLSEESFEKLKQYAALEAKTEKK